MKPYLLTLALLTGFASATFAAEDNPFKSANVGDWVEYKLLTKTKDIAAESTQKLTLAAKTDKTATIKVVTKIKDAESSHDLQIDLTKPFELAQTPLPEPMPKSGIKTEKLKEGMEKITAVGKEFSCTFTKSRTSGLVNNMPFETDVTVWVSKEVPLAGMVKLEMKASFAELTMELSGFGNEKK